MLEQRIVTALLLAVLALLVILWVPHPVTMGVLALLVLAGAWEWAAFAGWAAWPRRLLYVAAMAIGVAALWWIGPGADSVVLGAALLWWGLALAWVIFRPDWQHRGVATVAGFLVLIPAWLALVRLHAQAPQLVLFLLLLVAAADVGAYFTGRRFGRRKLAPQVSPGKTWEGAYGGLAAALVLSMLGVFWFKLAPLPLLAACAATALASIVGDLTESLFKRHVGLKDSGSLLPGHGGVLDRVDSVTAAAPVFLLGLQRLGLLS